MGRLSSVYFALRATLPHPPPSATPSPSTGEETGARSRGLGDDVVVLVEVDVKDPGDLEDEILVIVSLRTQDVDGRDDVQPVGQPLFGIVLDVMIHELSPLVGPTHEERLIAGTFWGALLAWNCRSSNTPARYSGLHKDA